MPSNRCLHTLTLAALAVLGISCSASTVTEGNGGSGPATGGASGGATGTGGVGGSGGVTSSGTGGNGTGGKAGSGTGGAANGGSSGGGNGGSGSRGAANGGSGSGGSTGSGGATNSGSGGGTAGNGGAGKGGATSDGSAGNDGSISSGTGGGTAGRGGAGSGGAAGTGSGGTAGASGTGGNTPGGTSEPSAGCGKTSTMTFTTVPGESGTKVGTGKGGYVTIQSSGQSRGFAMRLPDNYDNSKPYWLIFGFHWNGGNSAEVDSGGGNGYWWSYYGMQRKSNNNAIFVAPDGLNAGWANSSGHDLTFVDDMVKLIEENYCVDTKNIITMGFSYGGGMSYELACARAKVFRAAVIYEGGQLSGCDGGNDPIALWQMEGLTDGTVGMSMATPIRDRFVKNNGCTNQTPPQPATPGTWLNPGGHICTDYAGCSAGHPLRWCVTQSGHGPGAIDGTSDLYNSCATPPKTCSTSCPCTWTPDDVWPWLNGQTITGQTPNATK